MVLNLITSAADTAGKQPIDISHFIGDSNGISYAVASFIMKIVDWILGIFGLDHNVDMVTFLYAAVVFGVAVVIGYAVQWVVLKAVETIAKHWSTGTYQALKQQKFFHKICRIVPPLVFLALIQFTLSNHNALSTTLTKITMVYIVFVITVSITALIAAIWQHVDARANKKKLPLNGLAQLAKGIIWIIAVIVIISIIVDQSPLKLLTGLGAFSAVLMLIFKNNILSLVAGVQLSENDSLHVGDWIVVDGTNANGTVQDVSLVAVKVLNWDKTTTTLPPYNLISNGFTNYRTMQESNTRRICRSYMIDADSVVATTPQMLDAIRKVPMMDDYITKKLAQKQAGKVADVDNPEGLVDGTVDTNLGLFRAYIKMWLDANDNISHTSDCFVSTLAQTPTGIPLQIYCFTATSKWFPYEGIQDTVFEHIAAMLHYFGLYTFENPSGRDTIIDGFLSPGKDINSVFGIPEPFFVNSPDLAQNKPDVKPQS
ncbi:MAG: mechanosensitive ion channel family protein [Muribaculum sp.]|nr:mechanosensitive ion channel family protein [Muribaculaceae bacterium]MCM1081152.1 mechanosensitive ion channel family protein [Muribaculum sp.]